MMQTRVPHGRWVVWLSFLVAMLLQIMPLPNLVAAWRPDWLLLVMLYWAMALPHRYNILSAWILGVLLDILLGAHLGIRALAMSLTIYIVVLHFQRLRNFSMWKQSIMIAILVCFDHLLIFWLQFIVDQASFSNGLFFPVISSMLLWPWIFFILRHLRRTHKVS